MTPPGPDHPTDASSPRPRPGLGASATAAGALALALVLVLGWWLAGRTGPDGQHAGGALVGTLLIGGAPAALWLAAAAGYGRLLAGRLLGPHHPEAMWTAVGLGVAALLAIDATLARLHVLPLGGGAVAWTVLAGGLLLLAPALAATARAGSESPAMSARTGWTMLVAAPAVTALLVAAASAPGWLWSTEYAGYDVLSYHLELPREWLAAGGWIGTEHNVYGFLPSYVETAFLHLAALRGDAVEAACAAQFLHAGLALLTAGATGRLASRLGGPAGVAGVLVVATPWVVVTGSMAYDEMAVAFLLAVALLLVIPDPAAISRHGAETTPPAWRTGVAVGLLVGAACGSKLTAAGFVAVPVGLCLVAAPVRRGVIATGAAMGTAGIVLLPYAIGNLASTGNPCFPFLTGLLGLGHWSAEQAATWARGHHAGGPPGEIVAAVWNEWLRFGIGPAPDAAQRWRPQWAALPWLVLAAATAGLLAPASRRATTRLLLVIAVQLLFWCLLTHLKSRFLVPVVVPGAALVAVGFAAWWRRLPAPVLVTAGLALSFAPLVLLAGESGGRPAAGIGGTALRAGDLHAEMLARPDLTPADRAALVASAPMTWAVNHVLAPTDRILAVGEAAPFYMRHAGFVYQTTWDRGPLSTIARAEPDPARWIDRLRAAGFTHLLVDPVLLDVWEAAGWNDPEVTAARLAVATRELPLVHADAMTGDRLYALGAATDGAR